MNYVRVLLDLEQVKIGKEVQALDDWTAVVLHKEKVIEQLIPLQALVVTQIMTVNSIIINNLYFAAVAHQFPEPRDFQCKVAFSGP